MTTRGSQAKNQESDKDKKESGAIAAPDFS